MDVGAPASIIGAARQAVLLSLWIEPIIRFVIHNSKLWTEVNPEILFILPYDRRPWGIRSIEKPIRKALLQLLRHSSSSIMVL
jgi:hypothetical protein